MDRIGIYIHLPFCLQKCRYCDFASYAGLEHMYPGYIDALCREIAARSGGFADTVADTVYFGGGTPSILPAEFLEKTAKTLSDYFQLAADAEFTIEANPGAIDREKLELFKAIGANRLSLGVQAFDDGLLKTLGRIHTASEGAAAVRAAYEAKFTNISIDLMYGLPGQSLEHLRHSLIEAAGLGVNHISVYGLKIEEHTPFSQMREQGLLALPSDELEENMYDFTIDYLTSIAYNRYEISNFSQIGRQCRHNLKYWRYSPYLGFGAAAHSFIGGERSANTADVGEYINKITAGDFSASMYDEISVKDKMAEFVFLALRTSQGLYYQHFKDYFGTDFLKEYGGAVRNLTDMGLLAENGCRVFLTRQGMKFGNQVFEKFLRD